MITALVGAVVLGALGTFYDFIWAHFSVRHTALHGLVHGMTLLSAVGLVLAWRPRRPGAGLAGGAAVGLVSAASFYAFFPVLGYLGGIIAAWVVMWLLFAGLEAWLRAGQVLDPTVAARGAAAAALSGVAFYLVSGMWTDHSAPPDYLRHFASWTFAFFPGFAALLWRRTGTYVGSGAAARPN